MKTNKHRTGTVSYMDRGYRNGRTEYCSKITLSGFWLQVMGFEIGDMFVIEQAGDGILIKKA